MSVRFPFADSGPSTVYALLFFLTFLRILILSSCSAKVGAHVRAYKTGAQNHAYSRLSLSLSFSKSAKSAVKYG